MVDVDLIRDEGWMRDYVRLDLLVRHTNTTVPEFHMVLLLQSPTVDIRVWRITLAFALWVYLQCNAFLDQ